MSLADGSLLANFGMTILNGEANAIGKIFQDRPKTLVIGGKTYNTQQADALNFSASSSQVCFSFLMIIARYWGFFANHKNTNLELSGRRCCSEDCESRGPCQLPRR